MNKAFVPGPEAAELEAKAKEYFDAVFSGLRLAMENHNCVGISEEDKERLRQLGTVIAFWVNRGDEEEIGNAIHIILGSAFRLGSKATIVDIPGESCLGTTKEELEAGLDRLSKFRDDYLDSLHEFLAEPYGDNYVAQLLGSLDGAMQA